ncbi:MAG: MOSC domain-containing protein [Vulcanimicrobiaceae bacterium]
METAVGTQLASLAKIWTYPVKSLRPIASDEAMVVADGLAGDRRAALYVASPEHARTGNTYRGKDDNRLHLIDNPDEALQAAEERGVELEVRAGERYFDAGPVSLILDCWIAEVERGLGRRLDPLRWRPNLFASAMRQVSEQDLVGKRVRLGTTVLLVTNPTGRCVTTTYDQATGESDGTVLRYVALERDNTMGVYCDVDEPGVVRVGDILTLC